MWQFHSLTIFFIQVTISVFHNYYTLMIILYGVILIEFANLAMTYLISLNILNTHMQQIVIELKIFSPYKVPLLYLY
jgi:hypothetical protein